MGKWINWIFVSGFALIVLWGTWEAVLLLRLLSLPDGQKVMGGAFFTALRVICALFLSLLWTVPVGVAIGRNPRLAPILQPLVQIAASVPATALFPVLLLALIQAGGGLQIGSVALMMLGTMWYLLFNVIAGAQAIPSELFEAAQVYKLSLIRRWKSLILPGILPTQSQELLRQLAELGMPVLSANTCTLKVKLLLPVVWDKLFLRRRHLGIFPCF